ncbi:hypothetical protein MAM1_0176d07298 [Mucor ambiguus]|uniref:Uncharacterized protein n=1 Tax=Mucor ambiguus TaxID=91626 RepID=A0A0C9MK31_9FUNG|nr:hypothetical protein MAM1_0176d07298 [Mucor ambiguus]
MSSNDDKKLTRLPGSTLDPQIQVILFDSNLPASHTSSASSIHAIKRSNSLRRQNKPSTITTSCEKETDQTEDEIYSPWSG